MKKQIQIKQAEGRPPKFNEQRRPVTITLPIRTLDQLQKIHADRAKAIVKVTDNYASKTEDLKKVEIVEIEPGSGIILVGPSRILKKIPIIKTIEVAPARFLLSIPTGTSIDSLDIALTDILDAITPEEQNERQLIEELQQIVRNLRRDKRVTKAEMLFVQTRPK